VGGGEGLALQKSRKGEQEMTRKDYQLIAQVFARANFNSIDLLARDLATELEAENPRFDRARFLSACGVSE
jgi:hypothetical protein